MNNNINNNFFNWLAKIFKKSIPSEIKISPEEIKKQKEWEEIKSKYALEYVESYKLYFVKYLWRNQWWYLRKWDEDYILERVRGNAIRISKQEQLDQIIYFHQDWISEGKVYLPYE